MSAWPTATVRLMTLRHVYLDAVRIEIECRYGTTGLTSVHGSRLTLTRPRMVLAAVFEHEA